MNEARTIELFGKNISVRKYGCKNFRISNPFYIETPRVNLFVQTTNVCNADCSFCIYHGEDKKIFNLNKLEIILKELSSRNDLDLGKLNFTGGEPTLSRNVDFNELCDICRHTIRNDDRRPEVTLNTNGFNLECILKNQDLLDSIGLSRHHYLDDKNFEIFNSTSVPSMIELKNFMSRLDRKEIVQLRCNLIKNNIDSYKEMIKYLEHAIDIGIYDCGFVTLAPNNQYCKDHQIDFSSLIKISKDLIMTNSWTRLDDANFDNEYCQCSNYMYSNQKGQLCKFYARLFCNNDNIDGILVYDGEYLRHGFGGKIIF